MSLFRSKSAAFSLVEMMVTVAIIGVAGLGVVEVLRAGMILFSKNTSINLSHSESRFGLLELQQDLNSAASTPELTDSAGNILTSGTATGPAAGVSFQAYAGGPFCLYVSGSSVPSTATSIQVVTGNNFAPLPGESINIMAVPLTTTSTSSLIEDQLSGSAPYSATTSGTAATYTPTLANALGTTVNLKDPVSGSSLHVACFFTTPILYLVQNGELVKYTLDPAGSGKLLPSILSYNVTSATPFSMPTINNSPQNTFLDVQNFTAIDPTSSNRGYKSVTTPFTIQIPHFAQLTVKY
jgi:prepilin-type N-terminal cleavage/methylation domain-containing protein